MSRDASTTETVDASCPSNGDERPRSAPDGGKPSCTRRCASDGADRPIGRTGDAADRPIDRTGCAADTGTVLLADDEDAIRAVFRLWLVEEDGWNVREASDGIEALEKLDGGVDVLVLDREMPNCDGPGVLERLEETGFDGAVLVVSGCPPDSRLDESDVAGYAMKPIERQEFVDCLDRLRR